MKFSNCSISLLLVSLTLSFLTGCNGLNGDSQPAPVARVGNDFLTIEDAIEGIPEFLLKQDSVRALNNYRENWIQQKLILQEVERLRLRQNKNVQARLRKAENEILAEALKDYVISQFNEDLTVTDEEARNYYQANKNKFILNERYVRFRHIETNDLESARAARQALASGIPWPEVARRYSIDPEVKIKQSEQFWPESMALADLNIMNRYLKSIGLTERSPIQRINRTYHFVQLMDSKARGDHPDLEWLVEQIKDWLIIEKRRRHYSSYIKNLYLKARSNNEIDSYNVLTTNSNSQKSISDTLETIQTNE